MSEESIEKVAMGAGPPLTVADVPEPPALTAKNLAKWLGPSTAFRKSLGYMVY
jgi:hypothetical protein